MRRQASYSQEDQRVVRVVGPVLVLGDGRFNGSERLTNRQRRDSRIAVPNVTTTDGRLRVALNLRIERRAVLERVLKVVNEESRGLVHGEVGGPEPIPVLLVAGSAVRTRILGTDVVDVGVAELANGEEGGPVALLAVEVDGIGKGVVVAGDTVAVVGENALRRGVRVKLQSARALSPSLRRDPPTHRVEELLLSNDVVVVPGIDGRPVPRSPRNGSPLSPLPELGVHLRVVPREVVARDALEVLEVLVVRVVLKVLNVRRDPPLVNVNVELYGVVGCRLAVDLDVQVAERDRLADEVLWPDGRHEEDGEAHAASLELERRLGRRVVGRELLCVLTLGNCSAKGIAHPLVGDVVNANEAMPSKTVVSRRAVARGPEGRVLAGEETAVAYVVGRGSIEVAARGEPGADVGALDGEGQARRSNGSEAALACLLLVAVSVLEAVEACHDCLADLVEDSADVELREGAGVSVRWQSNQLVALCSAHLLLSLTVVENGCESREIEAVALEGLVSGSRRVAASELMRYDLPVYALFDRRQVVAALLNRAKGLIRVMLEFLRTGQVSELLEDDVVGVLE